MLHDSEFYRRLDEAITRERDSRVNRLLRDDCDLSTYKFQVGFVRALEFVRDSAQIVHDELMGIVRQEPKGDEDE